MELNPDDPFESLLIPIVEMNRRKRADYANESNIFKNFDYVAQATMGMVTPLEYCDIQVIMKTGRIQNLRGREAINEVIEDTYLDRAVYAILAFGLQKRDVLTPSSIIAQTGRPFEVEVTPGEARTDHSD
jgi:hypothetical protein